jgi:hypothetical protein
MADKTILLELDIETANYVKKVREAEINVANLRNEQDELYKSLEEIGETFGYNSAQYDKATQSIKKYDAAIKVAEGDVKNTNKQLEDNVRQNNAAAGSYEALYRQWKNAEIALKTQAGNLKQNADGTFELTEQGKAAAEGVLKLKEGVLKFNASIKDGRLNVGNYTQSIREALQDTGLFNGVLGDIVTTFQQAKNGFDLVQKGAEKVVEGFSNAKDNAKKLGESFSVTIDNAKNWFSTTQAAGDASEKLANTTQAAAETLTSSFGGDAVQNVENIKTATESGTKGFQGMRIATIGFGKALVATGIGALVVAVGSLIAYLSKLQSVQDAVSKVFAAGKAIFDTYLKTIFDIAKAILTLDFGAAIDSFTSFFSGAKKAAEGAIAIEEAKIALEKQDIKNLKRQRELTDAIEDETLASQDKTKSIDERIAAMKRAVAAEQELIQIEIDRTKAAQAIVAAEVAKAKATGEASREQLKELEELNQKILALEDEKNDKLREGTIGLSRAIQADNKRKIQDSISLGENELKRAELQGKNTLALQRRLAKERRDAELTDTTLTADEKKLIEDNYQTALAEINASAREERLKKEQETQQRINELRRLTIQNTLDGQQREIQLELLAQQERLAAVKKGTEQEQELRRAIVEESSLKILEIQQKYAEQTQAEQQKILDSNLKIQQAEIDAEANKQQQILELKLQEIERKKSLNQQLSAEEIAFAKSFENQILSIEQNRLQKQLNLALQAQGQRIANDQTYYTNAKNDLDKSLADGKITQEAYNTEVIELDKKRNEQELTTEQAGQAAIDALTTAIDANRIQQNKNTNAQITADNQAALDNDKIIQEARYELVLGALSGIAELLALDEKNRKKNADILKAIGLAELVINTQKEISGYWAGVGKDSLTGGNLVAGAPSAALASVRTAAAVTRFIVSTAKIMATKYAEGGYTISDAIKQYNPAISTNFLGGFVKQPTMWAGVGRMNLAGEAGTEYVSPNWQIKAAPNLFASLEQWRRTGVKPFADGGFTSSTISQPLMQTANVVETAIMRGFAAAPTPVVAVAEINNVQNRVSVIESRSTL